jgi:hypothetical protein
MSEWNWADCKKLERAGDHFLAHHRKYCAEASVPAEDRDAFLLSWDRWAEQYATKLHPVLLGGVYLYAEASLRLCNRLPSPPVWLDQKGGVRHNRGPWPDLDAQAVA